MTDKITLTVNDMTCNHCVATVRGAIEDAIPGTEVDIDLATRKVTFTGDRTKAEAAIREAGYTPEPM